MLQRKYLVALLLFATFATCGCMSKNSADGANTTFVSAYNLLPPLGGKEVMRNVFDDEQAMVYIKVDDAYRGRGHDDGAMLDIMSKEREWERMYPTKKLNAMSIVSCEAESSHDGFFSTLIIGLLVHYKMQENTTLNT